MIQTTGYLTLKRAAQVLGVHEQTLRAWERKGLIQMAHLPQSGYRRVPAAEVARLQTVMHNEHKLPGFRLQPPRTSRSAAAQAAAMAELVCEELTQLEQTTSFDDLMNSQRGRAWSP